MATTTFVDGDTVINAAWLNDVNSVVYAGPTTALGTPTSGNLTNCTADGTNKVGFLGVPQHLTGTTTLALTDNGKHIYNTTASQVYTIPAASAVAFPVGSAISFVNTGSGTCTIDITTDTMYLAGAGTTGTRTLAAYGVATVLKVTGTSSAGVWIISGSGLT